MKSWMKRNVYRSKSEEGAVVVEASISLTLFMFFVVTLLSIVNICVAQAKIGVALNATAKEISQYSYLYSLSGMNGVQSKNYASTAGVRENIDSVLTNMSDLYNSLSGIYGAGAGIVNDPTSVGDAYSKINSEIQNGNASLEALGNEFQKIASNPKDFIIGAAKLGINEGYELGKSQLIAAPLSSVFIQKHLKNYEGQDYRLYLKKLGIVKDIDFSKSVIFLNGSDDITLVADYEVEVLKLLNHDIKLHFGQSAVTKAWCAVPLGTNMPPKKDPANRPTWQESENDVAKKYPDYERRPSYVKKIVDGKEVLVKVPYGTPGSFRVDLYKEGDPGHVVDTHNFDISTKESRAGLVSDIVRNYKDRLKQFPEGTKQTYVIDVRGQNLSLDDKLAIIQKIRDKTNNGVEIIFEM